MNLGEELASLVAPLADACASPEGVDALLRDLGVVTATGPLPEMPPQLTALATTAQETVDAVLTLGDPEVAAAERMLGLVNALTTLTDTVAALANLEEQAVADLAAPFDAPELWSFLAEAIPGYLLTRWLRNQHRALYDPLRLLGVVAPGVGAPPSFDIDRLAVVLLDPGPWADAFADPGVLVGPLRRQLDARGATAASPPWSTGGTDEEAATESISARGDRFNLAVPAAPGRHGLVASVKAVDGADGPGLAVTVEGLDRVGQGIELPGGWTLSATGGAGTAGVVVGAGWAEPLTPGNGSTALDTAAIELTGRPSTPWTLLGQPGATRVELGALSLGLGGTSLASAPQVELVIATDRLRLTISASDTDSFLATLLGGDITANLALAGRWSPAGGLTIDGAAGLSVHVATTIALGPLTISGLTITLSVDGSVITLRVTTEIGGRVGPVSASIRGMGLRAELLSGESRGPAIVPLGPVAFALAFQPPDGATLSIDLGAAGGGWIDFDLDLGRYSGVIELNLLGIGICAVVIIDTKALKPGEWSLFFALFIDVPSIQLGFGFTLTGLGGLFGFNRTLDTAALESAVRSGSLDTVLFPADPVGQASEVVAELSALFPPSDGRYVFGPVVRIGWGTPTLIEVELGIVLSLPDPVTVAVLGSVTSVLPTEDVDLVAMRLNVAGVIDSAAGTLAIDASLHDSHMVGFALAGDMAVRAAFLDRPDFLMALGGFHPGFDEPDGFPVLRRLSLGLSAAPVIDISFECYVALASNSIQFGSAFYLSAKIAGFGVEGGASFDALVELSPFRLATHLGWYVAITAAGVDLAGVWLEASVEGPNPWLVVGTATFKILGIEEHIRVDEAIGSRRAEPPIPAEDALLRFIDALSRDDAWSVVASPSPGVVVAAAPLPADELVAAPDGILAVSQRAVPLGIRLEKLGDAPLGDQDTFFIEPGSGSMSSTGAVLEWFAPGYFLELTPGEQLSSPSFERLPSGIEFGGGDVVAGAARRGTLDFEEIVRDPELDEEGTATGVTRLDRDLRPELMSAMAGMATAGAVIRVVDDLQAVAPAARSFATVRSTTGATLGRAESWTAARQGTTGQRPGTAVVPNWEAQT